MSTSAEDRSPGQVLCSSLARHKVRRSTATSCRSTSSSASLEADDRPSRTSQLHSRAKMR